jgi:hypothetical protein
MRLMPYYAETDHSRPLEANNSSFCAVFAGLYGCLQTGAIFPQFCQNRDEIKSQDENNIQDKREREREDQTSFLT